MVRVEKNEGEGGSTGKISDNIQEFLKTKDKKESSKSSTLISLV